VRYASARRKPLTILSGGGDPLLYTMVSSPIDVHEELRAGAHRITDHALTIARKLAPDLDIEVTTPVRDARNALLESSNDASIVVVGTRGRGPVRSLLLGSVSAAVAEHAACTVAVVRPTDRDVDGESPVVVGTDGGPASTAALEVAFELASTEGRALEVVHSWSSYDTFIDPANSERVELMAEHERMLGESLAGYAEKYPDVPVTRRMPEAGAISALVDMSLDAWAVVIGARGRSGPRVLMGSVSRMVVERAHSTVVVVRP
jgi:nucleotide-binding universal stress UspA family protein